MRNELAPVAWKSKVGTKQHPGHAHSRAQGATRESERIDQIKLEPVQVRLLLTGVYASRLHRIFQIRV